MLSTEDACLQVPGTDIPSPLPLSNLGRVYFKFAEPIDAQHINPGDAQQCKDAYAQCKVRCPAMPSCILCVLAL